MTKRNDAMSARLVQVELQKALEAAVLAESRLHNVMALMEAGENEAAIKNVPLKNISGALSLARSALGNEARNWTGYAEARKHNSKPCVACELNVADDLLH